MYIRRLCDLSRRLNQEWSRCNILCLGDGNDCWRTEHESICRVLQDVNNNVHRGVKHDDLIRLNRLGVCVSPNATVTMQKKMNEQLEGKVQIWKASIEENKGVLLLRQEVLSKQIAAPQLDVSKRSLELYDHYSTAGYKALKTLLDK